MQQKLIVSMLLLGAITTPAATLIVNGPVDGTAADDALTLREAILLVDHAGDASAALARQLTPAEQLQVSGEFGDDVVSFAAALNGSTIVLNQGELFLGKSVTVSGPGAGLLTLSGNDANRIFYLPPGSTGSISGLTLSQGRAQGNLNPDLGGAIYNAGNLTLTRCILSSNSASAAGGYAGALANAGVAQLDACTVGPGNAAYVGGALYVGSAGALGMLNCTVSGNASSYFVGGVAVENAGTARFTNCTITANVDVGFAGGYGGDAPLFVNTIIAGNFSNASGAPDVQTFSGQAVSLGHNLVGVGEGTGGWLSSDLVGTRVAPVNPGLGPLMNHGGHTPTHALLTSPLSPAINAGDDTLASEFDQRGPGFTRMYGTIDIGAYELQFPVLKILQSVNRPVLFWPTNDPSYEVVTTGSLLEPVEWSVVTEMPSIVEHNFNLTNAFSEMPRFFRLQPK